MPLPLPSAKGPDRWLSFARASLLWADVLSCVRLGSDKVARRCQSRQSRSVPCTPGTGWITSSGEGTAASFSGVASVTVTPEASCAVMCPDNSGLLATGHQDGIRLWKMPAMTKLGVVRTRSPVVAVDLGRAGDFLAAVQAGSPFLVLCMWDLTLEAAGPGLSAPLWSINVPSASVLNFLGTSLIVPSACDGVELLDAMNGTKVQSVDLRGCPQAACRCTEPREWQCEASRTARTCILLAVRSKVLAFSERASTLVQGSEVFEFVEPEAHETHAELVALGASRTEVASATSDGRVLVWKLVERTLVGVFHTFTALDFENLSWSVGQAETVFPSQHMQMLVLEEVLARHSGVKWCQVANASH